MYHILISNAKFIFDGLIAGYMVGHVSVCVSVCLSQASVLSIGSKSNPLLSVAVYIRPPDVAETDISCK